VVLEFATNDAVSHVARIILVFVTLATVRCNDVPVALQNAGLSADFIIARARLTIYP
jgi:hypothetical protein